MSARSSAQNLEGREVVREAGAGQEVCDDEPEGEPQGQQDEDAARGVQEARPRRRRPARVGLTDCGASQNADRSPASDEVLGSVAEGAVGLPSPRASCSTGSIVCPPSPSAPGWSRSRSPRTGSRAGPRSTTTSCGRRWRSWTAGRRSTGRSRRLPRWQRLDAGRLPPERADRRPTYGRAPAVPSAAGDPPHAVRRDLGPGDRHPGRLGRCSARSTSGWRGGRSGAWRSPAGSASRRRSSSASAPSSGTRRSSGTTWFFAHVVRGHVPPARASGVALRADPDADDEVEDAARAGSPRCAAGWPRLARPLALVDRRQFLAGLLFGIACTARLTVVFGAPFFMFVGGGGTWVRRSVSAGLGALIPVGLLLAYNLATTGHVFHPGYEYQYQKEANGYQIARLPPGLGRSRIARYLPQNLGIMFLSTPGDPARPSSRARSARRRPGVHGAGRDDAACSIETARSPMPRAIGMSILLTSPAFLLASAGRCSAIDRASSPAPFLAVLAIALVNLMHFSQGWVQFGYRFSNDFVVFALPLVAVGMQRRGGVGPPRLLADRRRRRDQPVGRDLGQHPRMVTAAPRRKRGFVLPAGPCRSWRSRRRSPWRRWSSSTPGPGSCPASGSGTPASSRPCCRSWAPPTRPATRPTCSSGSSATSCSRRSASRRSGSRSLSLLAVATAAGATVVLVRRLTGSTPIGIAAGLGLALTPVVWANATRADPHPLHLAFVALLLLALVRWEDAAAREDRARSRPGSRGSAAGPRRRRVRARRRQPLADAAARAADRAVRARRSSPASGAAGARARVPRRRVRHGRARLPGAPDPRRPRPGLPRRSCTASPATWDGFWYIALAEQFRGSLGNPFADLGSKVDELVALATAQLGVLALAIPPAFIVTARRAPRYMLLTGVAFLITVLFNEAYANADIERYYLGPVLWVWTWLAILAAELAAVAGELIAAVARRSAAGSRRDARHVGRATTAAAIVDRRAPARADARRPRRPVAAWPTVPATRARRVARRGAAGCPRGRRAGQLVEHVDAALVRPAACRGLRPGHRRHRRPDDARPRPRTRARRDRALPGRGRPVYVIRLDGRDTEELQRQFDMTLRRQRRQHRRVARARPSAARRDPERGASGDAQSRAGACRRCRTSSRPTTRPRTSAASSRRRSRRCPALADDVRDHRRQRRLEGRDAGHRRRARRRAPRGARRAPPDEPRLRRRAPLRLRRRALRPPRVHRRRPAVQGRRHRQADRAAPGGRLPTSSSATASSAPIRWSGPCTRSCTGSPTGSSSGSTVRDVDCACKLFRGPRSRA